MKAGGDVDTVGGREETSVLTRRLFSAIRNIDISQVSLSILTMRQYILAVIVTLIIQLRQLIFRTKANVNEQNQRGENCLIEALRVEDSKSRQLLTSLLIKCGIDVYNRDRTQRGQ